MTSNSFQTFIIYQFALLSTPQSIHQAIASSKLASYRILRFAIDSGPIREPRTTPSLPSPCATIDGVFQACSQRPSFSVSQPLFLFNLLPHPRNIQKSHFYRSWRLCQIQQLLESVVPRPVLHYLICKVQLVRDFRDPSTSVHSQALVLVRLRASRVSGFVFAFCSLPI